MSDNRCTLCNAQADILAAIWDGVGLFDPPTGYACRACRPAEFRDLDELFVGGDS